MANATTGSIEALPFDATGIDLTGPIANAAAYADGVLAGSGLSTGLLQAIESNLAAHFASLSSPAVSRRKSGEIDVHFEGRQHNGMGLAATLYGQQAMALDYTGALRLANDSLRPQVSFGVVSNIDPDC